MFEKLRPVDSENTPLLPQRVKNGSISGFALLFLWSRNHARSALEWRSKFDGSDAISVYFIYEITLAKWKRTFEISPIFRIIVMT